VLEHLADIVLRAEFGIRCIHGERGAGGASERAQALHSLRPRWDAHVPVLQQQAGVAATVRMPRVPPAVHSGRRRVPQGEAQDVQVSHSATGTMFTSWNLDVVTSKGADAATAAEAIGSGSRASARTHGAGCRARARSWRSRISIRGCASRDRSPSHQVAQRGGARASSKASEAGDNQGRRPDRRVLHPIRLGFRELNSSKIN
jgi:hypothetical protein